MFLSKEDLETLTGKIRPSAQIVALRQMRIDHWVRPDGIPIVLVSTLEVESKNDKDIKRIEANFDAI